MIRLDQKLQIVIGLSIVTALVSWQIGFGSLCLDSLGAEDGGGGRVQIGSGNSFVELNNRAESVINQNMLILLKLLKVTKNLRM